MKDRVDRGESVVRGYSSAYHGTSVRDVCERVAEGRDGKVQGAVPSKRIKPRQWECGGEVTCAFWRTASTRAERHAESSFEHWRFATLHFRHGMLGEFAHVSRGRQTFHPRVGRTVSRLEGRCSLIWLPITNGSTFWSQLCNHPARSAKDMKNWEKHDGTYTCGR